MENYPLKSNIECLRYNCYYLLTISKYKISFTLLDKKKSKHMACGKANIWHAVKQTYGMYAGGKVINRLFK